MRCLARLIPAIVLLGSAIPPCAAAAALWAPDGTPVVDQAGDQRPAVALQEPGYFSPWTQPYLRLFWEDDRGGSAGTDLYAADVDWQGPAGPPFTGQPVVVAGGRQSGLGLDRTGPVVVPAPPGAARAQTSDGSNLLLAWADDRGAGTGGVWALQLGAFPAWPDTGVQVCDVQPAAGSIGVAGGDPSGGGIVAWIDARGGMPRVHAQRFDAAGTPLWAANGTAVSAAGAAASDLRVVADGQGGAYVTWREAAPTNPPLAQHRLVVQRLDTTGQPYPGWPAAGLAYGTSVEAEQPTAVSPQVTGGGSFLVWVEQASPGAGGDLFALRVLPGGGFDPAWPAAGLVLSGAGGVVGDPAPVADGSVVAWSDLRGGTSLDVYAQRFLPDGTLAPGWNPDGEPVCVASGDQIVSDLLHRGGRLVVGWSDARDGDPRAWVGGLLGDGAPIPGWEGGIALSQAAGGQSGPRLAWSIGDGIIAAWRDGRGAGAGGPDIYAQTVNRFGEVGVNLTGVPDPEPAGLRLLPARPDPSSGRVVFALDHPAPGRLRADVVDLAGRRIGTLRAGAAPAGRIDLVWDGRAESGAVAPPGVYLLRVESDAGIRTRRFIRLR